MDVPEIHRILHNALGVRVPRFGPDDAPGYKIQQLEDHLLKCAWHRGELEESRYWCIEAGKVLRAKWDGIQGYEVALPRNSKHTKEHIDAAKREVDRATWEGLQECRSLTDALSRQITRLGGTDYDACSRAYTLISGT